MRENVSKIAPISHYPPSSINLSYYIFSVRFALLSPQIRPGRTNITTPPRLPPSGPYHSAMDLIGAESRKSGTRGGRDQFNWDNVKRGEKEFYLGNSVAGTRPRWEMERDADPKQSAVNAGNSGGAGSAGIRDGGISERNEKGDELAAVRRRERAVLNAALGGECYSEAVRAHAISISSPIPIQGDSDSTTLAKTTADDMEIVAQSIGEANLDDNHHKNSRKAMRKEERRRRREERKMRREARQKRREMRAVRAKEASPSPVHEDADSSENDDTEAQKKKETNRKYEADRSGQRTKRRRTERQTGTKRKRSEVSSSDMVR